MAKLGEVINQLNEENKIPEDNFKQEKLDEIKKVLGSLVSKTCEWSGSDIMDVLQLALEDSNYHTENKSVTKLREQLKLQNPAMLKHPPKAWQPLQVWPKK